MRLAKIQVYAALSYARKIFQAYLSEKLFTQSFLRKRPCWGPSEEDKRVIMGFAMKARINTCIQEFSFLAAILV